MRGALLLAVALALGGLTIAPTASACSTGEEWLDDTCVAAACTVKKPTRPWINECWNVIGPPP